MIQGDACQNPVVKETLEKVGIRRFTRNGKHSPVPVGVADGRAGLHPCRSRPAPDALRQVKRLFNRHLRLFSPDRDRSDDMHLSGGDVIPDRDQLVQIGLRPGFRKVVRPAAHQIGLANEVCVPTDAQIRAHRDVRTDHGRLSEQGRQEMLGAAQVTFVTGRSIQLDEGHLDRGVAREPFAVERRTDPVRHTHGALQEQVLSGGTMVRDGGLDQMPGRCQAIGALEVPAIVDVHEIFISMRRNETGRKVVDETSDFIILTRLQHKSARFQPFRGVRAPGVGQSELVQALVIPVQDLQCGANVRIIGGECTERGELVVPVEPREKGRNACPAVGLHARPPESGLHRDRPDRNRLQKGVWTPEGGNDARNVPVGGRFFFFRVQWVTLVTA